MNNAHETKMFKPCARRQHAECLGAKFENKADLMGSYEARIVCSCSCHKQGDMFPAAKRQTDLFSAMAGGLFARKAS